MLNGLYTIFDSVIAQHDVYKVNKKISRVSSIARDIGHMTGHYIYLRYYNLCMMYKCYMNLLQVETIGDAYMLVSGLPVRNGDNHAIEITNCAMDLLTVVMGYKVQHVENYQLKIRIGE